MGRLLDGHEIIDFMGHRYKMVEDKILRRLSGEEDWNESGIIIGIWSFKDCENPND